MTQKQRRRILNGLKELGIQIEIPRENYHQVYKRTIYRNRELVDLLEEWNREQRKSADKYRRRARQIIKI